MPRSRQPVIEYRNYAVTLEQPVIVLTGERWYISPVRSPRLHFHNCLEIGYCHSGSGTMQFPNGPRHFQAGDVTCVARNVPHTTWSEGDTRSLWSYIFITPDTLLRGAWCEWWRQEEDPESALRGCHMILSATDLPALGGLVERLLAEYREKKPGFGAAVQGTALLLLIELLRCCSQSAQPGRGSGRFSVMIAPALDYVRENYAKDFPLEKLAQVCHLSQTHFRRLFHEETGTSPVAFLNQTRVLQSCDLLRATGLQIAEIAGRVGFTTLSSYNRYFAAMMGCSPRAWRKLADIPIRPTVLSYDGWTEAEEQIDGNTDERPRET